MFAASLPAASVRTEQGRAILFEQYRTLRQQVPLMYALMLVDAAFLAVVSFGTVGVGWSLMVPAALCIAGGTRALLWLRRKSNTVTPEAISRYLLGTTVVAAVLGLGFGGWGLSLYAQADLIRRACIALYISVGAISCCYCLQALPRAGYLVLLCGAMPVTACLIVSDDWLLRGVGFNIIVVAIVIMRMLRTSYAGFVEVITSRSEMAAEQRRAQGAEQRAHQLAYHDPLTGLPNRRALAEALEAKARGGEAPFGLLIVDLDRFKLINDVHGHPAGDQLLRTVAVRLSGIVEGAGQSYRLGGDEFAVVVDAGAGSARRLARAIVEAMSRPFAHDGRVHHIGASVGISLYPQDAADREALMRRADIALYKAKQEGRNRHCAFEPMLDAEIRRRAAIEAEMREAMERDAFVPYYQPIVDLKTGATYGFELLARWRRAAGDEIGPDQFIPIAEECGLINELTLRLLRRACIETRGWGAAIAINVSPLQLRDPWFSQKLLGVLTAEGFPPQRLSIEITENALIVDADSAKLAIDSLKNQGIRLALDDFGTGYSSLQHLRMLPFDKLKIDRSFVTAMECDPEAERMVHAIVSLASTLGLPVVAEGIESASTAKALLALGCALGQGFHFGQPMSRDEVEARLAGGLAQPA
ncbi:MAG: EAL domain-containing protein [Sphingomonas sp.]|uniref:putative bifunctional diguanylate cyclase/phosphodiesterase n=1 Tax=Sphingomonas sp. TaxID=28214 RepID=UPI001B06BAAF|nr:EAL domain-containing protein [Sphingomonas sp.]MBO9622892.1 EAL domain-containing protein [Sphingomonas sp.]